MAHRKFSRDFKNQVALDVINKEMSALEISKKYNLYRTQVNMWTREFKRTDEGRTVTWGIEAQSSPVASKSIYLKERVYVSMSNKTIAKLLICEAILLFFVVLIVKCLF